METLCLNLKIDSTIQATLLEELETQLSCLEQGDERQAILEKIMQQLADGKDVTIDCNSLIAKYYLGTPSDVEQAKKALGFTLGFVLTDYILNSEQD